MIKRNIMNIGNYILNIRKENQLTQEEFDRLFHLTRQTVSNWENGKKLSWFAKLCKYEWSIWYFSWYLTKRRFEDGKSMDKERAIGIIKHE